MRRGFFFLRSIEFCSLYLMGKKRFFIFIFFNNADVYKCGNSKKSQRFRLHTHTHTHTHTHIYIVSLISVSE